MRLAKHMPWLLAVSAALWLVLRFAFREAWLDPGTFLFSDSGDGLRGYLALSWQLSHGDGAWHELFQYPWGNHLLYVDLNPLLLGVMKLAGVAGSPEEVVLWTNRMMIWGFFPAAWLLYGTGIRLGWPPWYAALMALVITVLSPQIDRLTGHFALAQVWVLPGMLFSLLIWRQTKKNAWLIGGGVLGLASAWMHPYLGLIWAGLLLAWYGADAAKSALSDWKRGLIVLGLAILPLASVSVWEKMTFQGRDDFVTFPWGMSEFHAGPESIFLPHHGVLREQLDQLVPVRHYTSEGYAYVGLTGTLVFVWFLVLWVKKGIPSLAFPSQLRSLLLAATLLLIPAFAIPVNWFPDLAEWLGPFRQFRSPGRLAWVFFYAWMLASGWLIWKQIISRAALPYPLRWGLVVLAVGLWGWEANVLSEEKSRIILSHNKAIYPEWQTNWQELLASSGHDAADFQAILPLPFYHNGSEKVFRASWTSLRASMMAATRLGIPIIGNFAARAPLETSISTMQVVSHPLTDRRWQPKQGDARPLLLLRQTNEPLTTGEVWLWSKATMLVQNGPYSLGLLPVEAVRQDLAWLETMAADGALCEEPVYDSFGDAPFAPPGEAARRLIARNDTLWKGLLRCDSVACEVEISVWIWLDQHQNYLPHLFFRQFDGGNQVFEQRIVTAQSTDFWGEWAIARDTLTVNQLESVVVVKGKNVTFDRLLIRPLSCNVLTRDSLQPPLLWNNIPLTPNP